ncbi:MAG: alpha-glucosidase C-terminal domain-containing protein, partial [Chloroflexota bacterium]
AVNVSAQAANPSSLLWWMRRVIGLRRRHPALARGSFEVIPTSNRHVLAYRREHEDETIIAVANLSRYAQWFDIDLARDAGRRVVELFGGTEFPPITTRPYPLVLGPHSFLWFGLETADEVTGRLPVLVPAAAGSLAGLVAAGAGRGTPLAAALAQRLARNPAYRLEGTIASSTRVAASHDLDLPGRQAALLLVAAETRVGEVLTVPLVVEAVEASGRMAAGPGGVIARLRDRGAAADAGVVVDASGDARVARWLGSLALVEPPPGGIRGSGLRSRRPDAGQRARDPRHAGDHGSPATLHLVGRIEPAPLPEIVTAQALGAGRVLVEPVVASLEALVGGRPSIVGFATPERGGGRPTFADEAEASLDRLLDAAVAEGEAISPGRFASSGLFGATPGDPDDFAARGLAEIVVAARQVGESLAALHDALARPLGPPPEPFTSSSRRALYQSVRTLLGEVVAALRDAAGAADEDDERTPTAWASAVTASRPALDRRFRVVVARHLDGLRIATYGGPVDASRLVRADRGFAIGVPGPDFRDAVDRRRVRSPLLDVAAVLASLRRISLRPIHGPEPGRRALRPEDARRAEGWARVWWSRVGGAVVTSYAAALARPALIPSGDEDRTLLLDLLLAEVTLGDLLGDLRAGLPVDVTALVGLVDLAEPPLGTAPA